MINTEIQLSFKDCLLIIWNKRKYIDMLYEKIVSKKMDQLNNEIDSLNHDELKVLRNKYILLKKLSLKNNGQGSVIGPLLLLALTLILTMYVNAIYDHDIKLSDMKNGYYEIEAMNEAIEGLLVNEKDEELVILLTNLQSSLYYEASSYSKLRADMKITEPILSELQDKYKINEKSIEYKVIKEIRDRIFTRKMTMINSKNLLDIINQSVLIVVVIIVLILIILISFFNPFTRIDKKIELFLIDQIIEELNNQIA